VYFKAWDERDHNSIVLRQAESAGVDFVGYKVLDRAILEKLERDLREFGIKTERIAAGEMLETGERVRFQLPTGHLFELYAVKNHVGNGLGSTEPAALGLHTCF
jgi:catechol 2,3-dioxygenase